MSKPTIIINNSFCQIEGFGTDHIKLMSNLLTYENAEVVYEIKNTQFQLNMAYRQKNRQRFQFFKAKIAELEATKLVCWLREGSFPTGHLPVILQALDTEGADFCVDDQRTNKAQKITYKRNPDLPPLRYPQQDMLTLGIAESRGVFVAAVGLGKTRVAQELIYALGVPSLFIVPAKDLCIQAYTEFVRFFGERYVALIDDVKAAGKPCRAPIRITTIHTLTALLKRETLDQFVKQIGLVMWDEIHHCLTPGTKLQTDEGIKSIKQIVEGKLTCKVLSFNHNLNKFEYKKILKHYTYEAPHELIKLHYQIDGRPKQLICTKNHKIFTTNRGYVEAKDLTLKDDVIIDTTYVCACCDRVWDSPCSLSGHLIQQKKTLEQKQAAVKKMIDSPNRNSPEARRRNSESKLGVKNPAKRLEVRKKMSKLTKIEIIPNSYYNGVAYRCTFSKVYDIEIEDNHNYRANNILVSNSGAKSYTDILPYLNHIYFRFGFSGTFLRNDSRTLDMLGVLSEKLYEYTPVQAIKDGFLTPLKIWVHKIEGRRGNDYQREFANNYCKSQELLTVIRDIVLTAPAHSQILILVGRKEQSGHIVAQYLKEIGIPNAYVDGDCDREHTKQAIAAFNDKRVQVLIGSSVIGEGIDVRSTDHLILLIGGKSEIQTTQAIGRAVRLFPGKKEAIIHDFYWENTKYLVKHLHQRLEIYQKNFGAVLDERGDNFPKVLGTYKK